MSVSKLPAATFGDGVENAVPDQYDDQEDSKRGDDKQEPKRSPPGGFREYANI